MNCYFNALKKVGLSILCFSVLAKASWISAASPAQFLSPNCIAHAPERVGGPPRFSIEIDESPLEVEEEEKVWTLIVKSYSELWNAIDHQLREITNHMEFKTYETRAEKAVINVM